MTLSGIMASIFSPGWKWFLRAYASHSAKDNPAIVIVPGHSLNFQLVQSEIELGWGLVELGTALRAENRGRDAAEALERARSALLKGERYSRDLSGPESLAASSRLELLRNAIGGVN